MRVALNLHGLVVLESVTQVEEEEYEEVVKKPAVKVHLLSTPPPFLFGKSNPTKVGFGGLWKFCSDKYAPSPPPLGEEGGAEGA